MGFIVHTKKDSLLTFSGNKIHQLRKYVSYNSNILLQLSNLNTGQNGQII